jgi:hypothetical protein
MSHTDNFRVYVDKEGKCPVLSHIKLNMKSHPYYIRYRDNRPVARHGPRNVLVQNVGKDCVWCYHFSKFVPIDNIKEE